MAKVMYCWRCKMDIPMLDKAEVRQVAAAWSNPAVPGNNNEAALEKYFELTGFLETNMNAVHHHILDQYGPPCKDCGKPLRTHKAKWCAACGADVNDPNRPTSSDGATGVNRSIGDGPSCGGQSSSHPKTVGTVVGLKSQYRPLFIAILVFAGFTLFMLAGDL